MFDPNRPPATPILAASVILVRPRGAALEVLLVKRSGRSGFMSSSFVFPGGKVDAADASVEAAAVRELAEEANVTVAGPEALAFWGRWITPSAEPKRFDARFFVAELPDGQTARVDDHEAVELAWVTPQEGLDRHAAGDAAFRLPPPQLWTLTELTRLAPGLAGLRAELARRRVDPPHPYAPRFCELDGKIALLLPWDPEYATRGLGEGEPARPGYPGLPESRVVLDGTTFRLARP